MAKDYFVLFLAGGSTAIFALDYLDKGHYYSMPIFGICAFMYGGLAMMGIGKLVTM